MRIAASRRIPNIWDDLIRARFPQWECRVPDNIEPLKSAGLYEQLLGANAAVLTVEDELLAADQIAALSSHGLAVISNDSAGFNHVNIEACSENSVLVCNTPDLLTEAVAQHTFALMLSVARQITHEDRSARAGEWHYWDPYGHGIELGGILGLIGCGRIGRRVAQMAKAFNFEVVTYDPLADPEALLAMGIRPVSLTELLMTSDVISNHLPLVKEGSDKTENMLNSAAFAMMLKRPIYITTGRGGTTDTNALVEAIKLNLIVGAGIDVLSTEPPAVDDPILQVGEYGNVVITRHTASGTIKARNAMSHRIAENLIAGLHGKQPISAVNWDVMAKDIKFLRKIRALVA